MRIGVPRETVPGERRVAIVPESVKRLRANTIEVSVEAGAGAGSLYSDDDYREFGARIDASRKAVLSDADAIVQIRPPSTAEVAELREGCALVSLLYPLVSPELVLALARRKITTFAVDMIPRTTLAQMMDVLSSQATATGYEAVIMAAAALPRFFPMLMTAAGTIAPARVLVLGAGVAGLQAIGTARRLGAVVEAFDVRRVVKEQVESLGAKFVEVDTEDAQGAGGYARELSEDARRKQAEAIARHAAGADVVICTALIPGRRAPVLLTAPMVQAMRAGSVVVDLAAEQQGNCELTRPGETVVQHGVTIVGVTDTASRLSTHASQMYSRNMEKLLSHVTHAGAFKIDLKEEITAGTVITHEGEIVHAKVKQAAGPKSVPTPQGAQ
jgi:NAD(P) transhydrogenase subunit alpha